MFVCVYLDSRATLPILHMKGCLKVLGSRGQLLWFILGWYQLLVKHIYFISNCTINRDTDYWKNAEYPYAVSTCIQCFNSDYNTWLLFIAWCLHYPQWNLAAEWHQWGLFIRSYATLSGGTKYFILLFFTSAVVFPKTCKHTLVPNIIGLTL